MQSTRRTTMLPLRLFDLSCRRGTPYSTPTGVITRNAKVLSTLSSTRRQEWFPQGFETSLGRRGLLYATSRCDPRLKTSRIAPVRCHGSRGERSGGPGPLGAGPFGKAGRSLYQVGKGAWYWPALEEPGWRERVYGTHQPGNSYRAYRL